MNIGIINDTRDEHHYGCSTVMSNLLELLEGKAKIAWTWPVNKDWREHTETFDRLSKVDAVIVNGEGTIHHSKDRKQARALAEVASYLKEKRKIPSYLINATLVENEPTVYTSIKAYRKVFVRDSFSMQEAKSHAVEASYVPDLTFAKNLTETMNPNIKLSKVMCSSVLRDVRKSMRKLARQQRMKEISILDHRQKLSFLFQKPHKYLTNLLKWIRMGNKNGSFIEFANQISASDFVFTGRYHAVTLCIKYQTPFYAITSNTSKIQNLLNDVFGNSSREGSIANAHKINFDNYMKFSKSEIESMKIFSKMAEQAIEQMIHTIITDIKENH